MNLDPQLIARLAQQPLGNQLDAEVVSRELGTLRGWEARFRYLIQLGKQVQPLPEQCHDDRYRIAGCESRVWLVCHFDAASGTLLLGGESDARIVQGLIALVLAAYNGKTPREILEFDIEGYFAALDLLTHLSPSRGNGLRAIVAAIRAQAAQLS